MQSLKLLALLMDYPTAEMFREAGNLEVAAQTATDLAPSQREALTSFIGELTDIPLLDAQADYVGWFDRGRSLSLLLFEHVHGESRDRGQAMVDLMNVYNENGYEIGARELPDYIPLFLEYLSQRPELEARQWLLDVSHILALLETRLLDRESNYAKLFTVLLELSGANIERQELVDKVAAEEPDYSNEALDKVWEEEMVRFGAQTGDTCGNNAVAQRRQELSQVQPLNFVDAGAAGGDADQACG